MSEKIGALWARQAKNGTRYFTGIIAANMAETKIVIWPTKEKKSEKSPDYTINIDTYHKPEVNLNTPLTPESRIPGTDFVDDIPF